jgi:hypothetical protein
VDFLKNISDRRKDANDVSSNNAVKGHRIRNVINLFKPRSPILPSRPRRNVNVNSTGSSSVENKPHNVVSDGGKNVSSVAANNIVRNHPRRPRLINVNPVKPRDPVLPSRPRRNVNVNSSGSPESPVANKPRNVALNDITNNVIKDRPRRPRVINVNHIKHRDTKDVNNVAKDQQPAANNIKSEDTDIEPSGDSVFHIAEAIIADAANLEDKELMSNEKEFTANEVKDKLRSFVGLAKLMFKNTPLGALDILNVESTALKRVHTKVLAKVCTDAFNKIKDDKDIKKCVNDLSDALIRYSKSETVEDCKKIILIQGNLRKAIKNAKHIESVNEVLNTVFVRAAVDKFYKKFGNLNNPNTTSDLKAIFNSIYNKSIRIASVERGSLIDFDTHLNNLIYGFGFYPSSVDIELKNLSGKKNVKTAKVLSALGALSKEHALTIKNGKKFEIVNTGSYNDRNCAFRAISIGAGFGPNGYNIVQQKVVKGAEKLLKMWDSLDHERQDQIARMLIQCVDTSDGKEYTLGDVKKLLKEYIDCRGQGFISGVQNIECLFAAIGLGRPICVSDNRFSDECTFLPDGRKEDGIRDDYSAFDKPIYVGFISGHAEALLPLDNKGLRKIDNKLPELDKKASDMKDAISKHISGVIYDAINEQSNLLKIIARDPRHIGESFIEAFLKDPRCKNDKNLFVAMKILAEVDSKLYADKRADAYNLEKEIRALSREKVSRNNENRRWFPRQEKVLQNKLKQFVDIFADRAVELCQKKPLFWDNIKNSVLREW